MIHPDNISENLIERLAKAMRGFNSICNHDGLVWDEISAHERQHWCSLAKVGLLAISPFINLDKERKP